MTANPRPATHNRKGFPILIVSGKNLRVRDRFRRRSSIGVPNARRVPNAHSVRIAQFLRKPLLSGRSPLTFSGRSPLTFIVAKFKLGDAPYSPQTTQWLLELSQHLQRCFRLPATRTPR